MVLALGNALVHPVITWCQIWKRFRVVCVVVIALGMIMDVWLVGLLVVSRWRQRWPVDFSVNHYGWWEIVTVVWLYYRVVKAIICWCGLPHRL